MIFVVSCLLCMGISAFLSWYYSKAREQFLVRFCAWLGCTAAVSVTFLVPYDIVQDLGIPSDIPRSGLYAAWEGVFWTCFILTWLVLPFLMGYVAAGEFTFKEKAKASLRDNMTFYGSLAVVGAAVLVWVAIQKKLSLADLPGVAVAASNAWGLLLLAMLLGHGLVDVPRSIWCIPDAGDAIVAIHANVARAQSALDDATEDADRVVAKVNNAIVSLPEGDERHEHAMDIRSVMQRAGVWPDTDTEDSAPTRSAAASTRGSHASARSQSIALSDLASLHREAMSVAHELQVARFLYREALRKAHSLSPPHGIGPAAAAPDAPLQPLGADAGERAQGTVDETAADAGAPARRSGDTSAPSQARRLGIRTAAVAAGLLSGFLLAALLAATVAPDTPLVVPMLRYASAAAGESTSSFVATLVLAALPLAYLAICAYRTLFQLRIAALCRIVPRHSDAYSLLFASMYLCRLLVPLGYSYVRIAAPAADTLAFADVMARAARVPLLGNDVQVVFPWLLVLLVILHSFDVFARVTRALRMHGFLYEDLEEDDAARHGAAIVARERRRGRRSEQQRARQSMRAQRRDSQHASSLWAARKQQGDNGSTTVPNV